MAPRVGARIATTKLLTPLTQPSLKVLSAAGTPTGVQYALKNTGKKPAITVVAKAEFAQSYSAHASTCLRSSMDRKRVSPGEDGRQRVSRPGAKRPANESPVAALGA